MASSLARVAARIPLSRDSGKTGARHDELTLPSRARTGNHGASTFRIAIMTFESRIPEHPVDPIFLKRRSWRALTGEEIPDADLNIMFEAARWAPSAAN